MLNPMDYTGRLFLVTGASSGIGRETAILLSRLGARVLLVGRDQNRLEQVCLGLEGDGHAWFAKDLSESDSIPAWLKSLVKDSGPLDGLVHCAGVHAMQPLRMVDRSRIETVFGTNVNASFGLVRAYRQSGVPTGFKSVVLVSSVVGLVGQAGVSVYSASKGAVLALTKSLALELAHEGIRVNCVAPGLVQSEMKDKILKSLTSQRISEVVAMHPLGLGRASDVAMAVAFLLGETARWITGSTLVVDGGYSVA